MQELPTDCGGVPSSVGNAYVPAVPLDTLGQRIADIRARLGAGPSRPLSQQAFAALIERETGVRIHRGELSRLERDARGISLAIVDAISRVDPAHRGREWLAWGADSPPSSGAPSDA